MPTIYRHDSELKTTLHKYFSGEKEAFATTLVSGLIRMYGVEALEWDPLTLQLEIKNDLGVEMSRKVFDKMMGLIAALTTDSVYKDVAVFDETISALVGDGVGVERGVPTVYDTAWAVTELQMNDPDPVSRDPRNPWSRNIAKYVRVILDDAGFNIAPKALNFAENRPLPKEGFDDPSYYAGAWGSQQEKATEVDIWLEEKAVQLIAQLMGLGVELDDKGHEKTGADNYTVKPGDTLSGVFGDQWEAVASHNKLIDPNRIYPGQQLALPGGVAVPAPAPALAINSTPSKPLQSGSATRLTVDQLSPFTSQWEGFSQKPYTDTVGRRTIGYGTNLDAHPSYARILSQQGGQIDEATARQWLNAELRKAITSAELIHPNYSSMPTEAQKVIADMIYNMGVGRAPEHPKGPAGYKSFAKTRKLFDAGKWSEASQEMLRSKWAEQTGRRAKALADIISALDSK